MGFTQGAAPGFISANSSARTDRAGVGHPGQPDKPADDATAMLKWSGADCDGGDSSVNPGDGIWIIQDGGCDMPSAVCEGVSEYRPQQDT